MPTMKFGGAEKDPPQKMVRNIKKFPKMKKKIPKLTKKPDFPVLKQENLVLGP